MTSPDGITWTLQTSTTDNIWTSVTYGNGLFVAVARSGIGNRVMTSPDGITWTLQTSAADNIWTSVTYGNGLFVAVARSGIGNRVMTSPDGITWTLQTSAADNFWGSVTYGTPNGDGLFVAVARSGTNKVMTATVPVNQSTPTNPVIINNSDKLLYFINTNSTYGNITNNLEINYDLIALSYKVITGNNITITKFNN